jgi:hypothetical protein
MIRTDEECMIGTDEDGWLGQMRTDGWGRPERIVRADEGGHGWDR